MSLPSLLQGSSVGCGPDNPLVSLSKAFNRDQSLHQDGLQPNSSNRSDLAQRSDGGFLKVGKDSKPIEERNIFGVQGDQPFDFGGFHQELNRVQGIRRDRVVNPKALTPSEDWSSSFLKTVQPQFNQQNQGSQFPSLKQPGWQDEFLRHQIHPGQGFLAPSSKPGTSQALSFHRPLISNLRAPAGLMPIPHLNFHGHQSVEHFSRLQSTQNISKVEPDWDHAFSEVHNNLSNFTSYQGVASVTPEVELKSENQGPPAQSSSSPDALARTAASLIEVVDLRNRAENGPDLSSQGVDGAEYASTADKFNNSSFMDFMRKLRDGEVKVEGDQVVEQTNSNTTDTEISTKGKERDFGINDRLPKGNGGVWANDYAHAIPNVRFQDQRVSSFNTDSKSDIEGMPADAEKELDMAKLDLENRMKEMNDVFEEADAEREREIRRALMNRFQGDGGSVPADLDDILGAADEVGRPEWQNWKTTHVPGASESWTETFEDSSPQAVDSGFDEKGMFGRPLSIHELEAERLRRSQQLPSDQQREWDKLQSDWEEGLGQAEGDDLLKFRPKIRQLSRETGYSFQSINPYLLDLSPSQSSHHHSFHEKLNHSSPESMHYSSVGLLQKEAEVLKAPESAVAWLELGVKQQENEREHMAIQALKKAIELDPNLSDAILALSISYTNENRRHEALQEIGRWITVEMGRVPKYRSALEMHSFLNQPGSSDSQANQPSPTHDALTECLINLARMGGRVEGTASVDADVQIVLGVLFNLNGEFEKASDCFGAALSVRPEDPLLFNRLGATLANSGKPDQAIEYYSRALELLPTYIRARYNLSISLINLGHYQESAENLLSALEMQEADSDFRTEFLGSIVGEDRQGIDNDETIPQRSGVTSEVLWQTLEVNCSLLGRPGLSGIFETKDLRGLRKFISTDYQ